MENEEKTDLDFVEHIKTNMSNQFAIAMVNIIRAVEHENIKPGCEVSKSLGEVEIGDVKYQMQISLTSNVQQFIEPMDILVSESTVTNDVSMRKSMDKYDIN